MSQQPKPWSNRRTIVAGVAGNVLEWYDFAVYGFFASIIAGQFFPGEDPTASLIAAFGAFAAGFLMRPVGGALFGHIGDRIGRGRALILSVLMMAIPTGLIGLLPTHDSIGVAASVLMVVMRMLQGLAVGGEYTSSFIFLAERAPNERRGFFSAWSLTGAVAGILLGSLVGAVLSNYLTDDQLASWGWRVAFLMGIAVALVSFAIRRGLQDEPKPEEAEKPELPLKVAFRDHWRGLVHAVGLNIANGVIFYLMFVYIVTWLVTTVHEPKSEALDINSISMAALAVLIPIAAMLSDRFGRKPLLLIGLGGLALFSYPLIGLMHHPDAKLVLLGQLGMAVLLAGYMAASPATLVEMFPHKVRVTAVSVGYNFTIAVFGGTSPIVAVWLLERTHDDMAFVYYIIATAVISFIAALMLKDRTGMPLDQIE